MTLSASGGFESLSLAKWLTWPMRFWSIGPVISETVFDGGLRRAQTDEARAAYDATVASYRQTVLTGSQEAGSGAEANRRPGWQGFRPLASKHGGRQARY